MYGQFLVGVSETDITPPIGLVMDGYMARAGVSVCIHDPLLAQVLVLDDGRMCIAIVAMDVLAVSARFADSVRQSLATVLQTTPDAVLVCASHTHAGPAGLQDWFPVGLSVPLNAELTEMITARLIDTSQSAASRMAPARFSYGVGHIERIGSDRNEAKPAPDDRLTAFRFDALQAKNADPLAIIFHYACHPTVLGTQLEYSADFPGAARVRIRRRYPGAICLYLNGAAGNISTRFSRCDQSFAEVTRLGSLLGDHVIALLERAESGQTDLGAACEQIDLPFRVFSGTPPTALDLTGNARIDQTTAEGAQIDAQLGQAFRGSVAHSATVCNFRLGPWHLLSVPGEAFSELAAALHEVSPYALVVGYANNYLGYLPTQRAIDSRTYEALSSPYDARAHAILLNTFCAMLRSD